MITSFSSLLLPPWAEERVTDIQFYFVVLIDIFYYGHTFGVRVLRVLRVLKFDGLSGRGLWWRLTPLDTPAA
jgi:hypothetical protein